MSIIKKKNVKLIKINKRDIYREHDDEYDDYEETLPLEGRKEPPPKFTKAESNSTPKSRVKAQVSS